MSFKSRLILSLNTGGLLLSGMAHSQEIGLMAADAYQPRFQYLPPVNDLLPKGGVSYALTLKSVYDSNFFLEEKDANSEVSMSISPSIMYRSDVDSSAQAWVEVEYNPAYQYYLENSDLSNFQQNFNGTLNLQGSRTKLTFYGRYSEVSGTDRLSEGYAEGSVLNYGVIGTYQLAARTTLGANLGFSSSSFDTGQQGSDTFSAGVSANWAYSERLSFGPYFRYSMFDSGSTGTEEAYAFLIQANYLLGERIRINGSLGIEDSISVGITGDLTASYGITERMTLGATVRYATVPAPSAEDYFVQDLTVATQLTRQLTYGTVGLGLAWSTSYYESTGGQAAPVDHDNGTYTNILLSYTRNFFQERAQFDASVGYSFSQGETDYDRWLVSLGVRISF